jgi:2-oxoisovalerate dehydrogenase E1 component
MRRIERHYLTAYKIRRVEESLLEEFSTGTIAGTIHTCIGQEFIGIAVSESLRERDVVISNHRCHGHYISRFGEIRPLVAELFGKPSGVCRGFGGSQHLHRPGFYSSGIQGGMVPSALGLALVEKRRGEGSIVVVYLGDGTFGQGVVYEGLNLAALWRLPVLFVVENNHYAQSTKQEQTLAGTFEDRAKAFQLDYISASTFEPETLMGQAKQAVERVRNGSGPVLFEIETYRLSPHSKGDDTRDAAELEAYRRKDPLNRFLERARESPSLETALKEIEEEIRSTLDCVREEEDSIEIAVPPAGSREMGFSRVELGRHPQETKQVQALNTALHEAFREDPEILFFGEDIQDPYGGAFKVSRGLSERFPGRVFNMPISEASIVGTALGVALGEKTAIAEIMFGDFLALAFDQIVNHAGKFHSMFGREIRIPLVIRAPMGGGRGYGPTHSQSLEKHFVGAPGVDVYVVHPRVDIERFYRHLLQHVRRTALVIENKLLYGCSRSDALPEGYELHESEGEYPVSRLLPAGVLPDVTVVSIGGVGLPLETAVRRLSEEEVYLDVFYPLRMDFQELRVLQSSLGRTGKLLVLEEGTQTLNLASEYTKRLVCGTEGRTLVCRTLSALDLPLPSAKYLENQVIPGTESIVRAVLDLYDA